VLLAACALALGMTLAREPLLTLFLAGLLFIAESFGQRVLILAAAIIGAFLAPDDQPFLNEPKFVRGEARIVTVPRIAGSGQSAIVEINGMRLTAFLPTTPPTSYGDRMRVAGVARPPREGTEAFLRGKGAVGRLDWAEADIVARGPALVGYGVMWRDAFRSFTERNLSKPSKEAADALCFNVDASLDPDFKEDLRRTGTVHIVSASGLHVGIFAFFLQWFLSKIPVDRRWQLVALFLVLILYMGATGMRPPVVRSVVMAATLLTAYLWKREADLLSALGIAAIIQLMWDPWSSVDLGLHLSFVAVLALGLFVRFDIGSPLFLDRLKLRVRQTVHASIVASLATAPIVAWSFGYVSLIAPLANLLIAPLVLVIVPVSLTAWALAWAPALAQTLMLPVELACRLMTWLVANLADLPFAAIDLPAFSAWWIPVCYVAMIGLWRKRVRPA
jgi:competence protein ComEC